MSSYFIQFKAGVDRLRKPDGFPEEVTITESYTNVESLNHIREIVNQRFKQIIDSPGLVVLRNPSETLTQGHITFDKRIFLPWHVITYFHAEEPKLITELPPAQELIPGTADPAFDPPPPTVN